MKETMKTWLQAGLKNGRTLLYFEIVYKVTGLTVLAKLAEGGKLLTAAAIILSFYYVYFEVTTIIVCCEAGWRQERLSVWRLFRESLSYSLRLFHIKNLPILLVLLPLIGISALPLTSGLLNKLGISAVFFDLLQRQPVLLIILAVGIGSLYILLFFCLFRFPRVIFHGASFGDGARTGHLLRGRKLETAAYLLTTFLLCVISLTLGFVCMCLLLWLASKWPSSVDGGRAMFQFYYGKWSVVGAIVADVVFSSGILSMVVTLYHRYSGDVRPVRQAAKWMPRAVILRTAAVFFLLGLLAFYSETELGGNLFYSEYDTKIVAHRAGAAAGPENTIAALEAAVEADLELAEIDVQQTRDGVLIVMHDDNFKRTANLNQKVWETDYETVKSLDAGSHFSAEFAGERIPTLREMLLKGKDRIHLILELKRTGHERDLVAKTIETVRRAGMSEQCTVSSMDLGLLKESKALAPEIETIYVTKFLKASLFDHRCIDGYSVEVTFLSPKIVAEAHSRGKKVYGWTANTKEDMKKILRLGTDGLVTDHPRFGRTASRQFAKDYVLEFLTERLFPG